MTLEGYRFRRTKVVQPQEDVTDKHVRFNIWKEEGYDDGPDVYLDTRCKSDLSDIRFTLEGSDEILPYYIEDPAAEPVVCMVRVPTLSAEGTAIWLYFGNTAAESASNGAATFDFFEDFSSDLSKWNTVGAPTIIDGKCRINTSSTSILSKDTFGAGTMLRCKRSVTSVNYSNIGFSPSTTLTNNTIYCRNGSSSGYVFSYNSTTYTSTSIGTAYAGGVDHIFEIRRDAGVQNIFLFDDAAVATHTTNVNSADLSIVVSTATYTTTIYVDWIYVANLVSGEIIYSHEGEEVLIYPNFESVYSLIKVLKNFESVYTLGKVKSYQSIYSTKVTTEFESRYNIEIYIDFESIYQTLIDADFETQIRGEDGVFATFRTNVDSEIGTIASRMRIL